MDTLASLVSLLVLIGVAWVAFVALRGLWRSYERAAVTVMEYETGLAFDNGRFSRTLPPGRYHTWPREIRVERVDLREQSLEISGQEILTADALPVRVSLSVRWRVSDARLYWMASQNPFQLIYGVAQIALRKRVAGLGLDALLADRAALERDLTPELNAALDGQGIEIIAAAVKDLSLVGVAKQAFADLWKAQKEGLAALERARGEQAGLRALANAARMLKGNPELMNLRLLQALAGKPGQPAPTVVLGGGSGLLPVQPGDPSGGEAADAPT